MVVVGVVMVEEKGEKEEEERRGAEVGGERKREEDDESRVVCSVSPRCIAAVVHIRANRKIDKKRRFVKCRGRFNLLAATGIERRATAPGGGNDSHPRFLPLFPVSIGTGLLNPFAGSRWHRVGIRDTNAAHSYWILRLCLAHNGFCFERNFVGAAVGLPRTPWLRSAVVRLRSP